MCMRLYVCVYKYNECAYSWYRISGKYTNTHTHAYSHVYKSKRRVHVWIQQSKWYARKELVQTKKALHHMCICVSKCSHPNTIRTRAFVLLTRENKNKNSSSSSSSGDHNINNHHCLESFFEWRCEKKLCEQMFVNGCDSQVMMIMVLHVICHFTLFHRFFMVSHTRGYYKF